MKRSHLRFAFGFFIGWQLMTALYNVTQARWDWVGFDLMCAAIVLMSWAITERSLRGIRDSDRRSAEQVGHYRQMLDAMRREGDERGEQYALTMLSIWGWKGDPVPEPPPGQGEDQGRASP